MTGIRTILSISIVMWGLTLSAQKTVSEATLVYDIVVQSAGSEPKMADAFDGATSTTYIKGNMSRTDMVSLLGNESTVYDNKTGNAFVLKEYSGQKLMITLTKKDWEEKNKVYDSISYDLSPKETKVIAGYNCRKALAKLKNGRTITLYYTTELALSNKEYDATFKNLNGVAMQYEYESGKTRFTYTVSKVNFESIPAARFEAPKSGYRVMTYEENKKLKKEGN